MPVAVVEVIRFLGRRLAFRTSLTFWTATERRRHSYHHRSGCRIPYGGMEHIVDDNYEILWGHPFSIFGYTA